MRKSFYIKPKNNMYIAEYIDVEFSPCPVGKYFFYCCGPFSEKEAIEICKREFDKLPNYIFKGTVNKINDERDIPNNKCFYRQWWGKNTDDTKLDLVEL